MRLLVLGPADDNLTAASGMAIERGADVSNVTSIAHALRQLRSGKGADLILIHVTADIQALIAQLAQERIMVPVVACGQGDDRIRAVRAIRAGAREFIPLPAEAEMIAAVLAAISDDQSEFVFRDPAMARLKQLARHVAPSDANVLITGESGTGKERIANFVHDQSRRAKNPFIAINCAAVPEHLLESELFGHEKGAFTGASARRIGKFEEANGGTLLLDEVSEMDVRLQAKLLRAVQERVIDRLGGRTPVPINIRILSTSNQDLLRCVDDGTFRADLYYRLNVVNLHVPPLRERPGDILALAEHFSRRYAQDNGQKVPELSPDARSFLLDQRWPGNVRELENSIQRAVIFSRNQIINRAELGMAVPSIRADSSSQPEAKHKTGKTAFPDPISDRVSNAAQAAESTTRRLVGRTVSDVEQGLILDTLGHCFGNRTHAATMLGISIRTLRNKLRVYTDAGVDVPASTAESRRNVG